MQDDEAAKQIHSQFMQMALQLVDGRLDSSQYEDSCRQLLGMHHSLLCMPHDAAVRSLHTCLSCNFFQDLVPAQLSTPMHVHLWAPVLFEILDTFADAYLPAEGVARPGLVSGSVTLLLQQYLSSRSRGNTALTQRSRHTLHALTCHYPTPAITHSLQLNTCRAVDGHADTAQTDCVTVA